MTSPENTDLPRSVADAQATTLRDLRDSGERIGADDKVTLELLGYRTGMANPHSRITPNMGSTVGAVARFVWLIAGSDRLADIAFYESRARDFSDDDLVVPGSSYGRRLFSATPGLNQIVGVVEELRKNPDTRRAAAVVWLPEDAVRLSKDIPCTFGLFFHIRDGQLTMTTVMRSNNAGTLLAYNFFEFSMLGEMIAASVGVPLGRYVHWAASMHYFDKMQARVQSIIDGPPTSYEMPPMPQDEPLEYGRRLAILEARLRHAVSEEDLGAVGEDAEKDLIPYWLDLFNVLYSYNLAKRGARERADDILNGLPDYLRLGSEKVVRNLLDETAPLPAEEGLFGLSELELADYSTRASMVAEASLADSGSDFLHLAELIKNAVEVGDDPVTLDEFLAVRDHLVKRSDVTLAARSAAGDEEPSVALVTLDDVRVALRHVRNS